ncbi:hypothetical protein HK102_007402 [Quaeritorhiza haematococci]|nr:hypothetical protein HK102_007402 [Quaeritorhiza haematococci]
MADKDRKTTDIRVIAFDCGGVLAENMNWTGLMEQIQAYCAEALARAASGRPSASSAANPAEASSTSASSAETRDQSPLATGSIDLDKLTRDVTRVIKEEWDKSKISSTYDPQNFWDRILHEVSEAIKAVAPVDLSVEATDNRKVQNLQLEEGQQLAERMKLAVVERMQVFPDVIDIAMQLQKNGYIVGIISNHTHIWWDFVVEKFPEFKKLLSEYLEPDLVLVSADVECAKPDKKIYEIFLDRLNNRDIKRGRQQGGGAGKGSLDVEGTAIEPREILFVDDKERNFPSAREVGFRTLLFNREKEPVSHLVGSLQDLGIKI